MKIKKNMVDFSNTHDGPDEMYQTQYAMSAQKPLLPPNQFFSTR